MWFGGWGWGVGGREVYKTRFQHKIEVFRDFKQGSKVVEIDRIVMTDVKCQTYAIAM
jgi:hypothetical protein